MVALLVAVAVTPMASLNISCDKPEIKVGEAPTFKIAITNKARTPMLLIQPGDGSDWHMRTPYTGWAVKAINDRSEWPAEPPRCREPRCGNMNGLTEAELVDLKPGQSVVLNQEWLYNKPKFEQPGKYRVVFFFWQSNSVRDTKLEIPSNSPRAVERVSASEPYRLRSNELIITVKPA